MSAKLWMRGPGGQWNVSLGNGVLPAVLAAALAIVPASLAEAAAVEAALPPSQLECVPYARQLSGIEIYGNADTWWKQAAGRYPRGREPQVGAVLVIEPHANSHFGHVAVVSRIVDDRTIRISHANWSLIDGRRGQIERNVRAVDVSSANDWSEVRVWYAPIGDLGTTHWPVAGFIYGKDSAAPQGARRRERASRYADPIGDIIRRNARKRVGMRLGR